MKNGGPKGPQRGAQDGPKMDHFRHPAPKGRPKRPQGAQNIEFGSKTEAKNGPKIDEKWQASKVGPRAADHRAESSALRAQIGAES